MELLRGNLDDENRRGKISADEALLVLSQGLLALQYLHAQGYAHRDIKPANILVQSRRPMHIKLADFGVSQDVSALVTICGTSMYHAPELWAIAASSPDRRKRRLGGRSKTYTTAVDIWALGVVIVQLVYRRPSMASSDPQNWPKIIVKAVNDLETDPLVELLRAHMLAEDYSLRSSAADCLQRLSAISKQASDGANLRLGSGEDAIHERPQDQLPAKKHRRSERIHKG